MITAGDEALALLLLENSWEHWREQYNMGFEDGDPSHPNTNLTTPTGKKYDARSKAYRNSKRESPKYTKTGGGKKEGEGNGGWSQVGIDRFNELFEEVKKSRREDGKKFDAFWKKYQLERRQGENGGRSDECSSPSSVLNIPTLPYAEFSDCDDNADEEREKLQRRRKRFLESKKGSAEGGKKKRRTRGDSGSDSDSEDDDGGDSD